MEPKLAALITIGQLLWIIVSLLIIETIIEEKIRRYKSDKFIEELETTYEDYEEEKENIFSKIKNFFVRVFHKIKIAKKNLKRKIAERLYEDVE